MRFPHRGRSMAGQANRPLNSIAKVRFIVQTVVAPWHVLGPCGTGFVARPSRVGVIGARVVCARGFPYDGGTGPQGREKGGGRSGEES